MGGRDRLGDRLCPGREPWPLEDPHRAVPEDRPCTGQDLREQLARARTDVEHDPAVRECVGGTNPRFGVGLEPVGPDHVDRQHSGELERVRNAQLFGQLPSYENCVGASAEMSKHTELVVGLGASADEDEGALDLSEQTAEMLQLELEQQPRIGRKQLSNADRRGMGAMNGAKRVLHEEIVAVREHPRERGIVACLPA